MSNQKYPNELTTQQLFLIKKGEGLKVEFKTKFHDETIETLTAMANTKGGTVIIGLSDKKEALNLSLGQETINKWLNEIKHKTDYKLVPDVSSGIYQGKNLVFLSVSEQPNKPLSFRGRYYKRYGSSNHLLSTAEISAEFLRARNRSWDLMIAEDYSLADLDLKKVESCLKRLNKNRDLPIKDAPKVFLKKFSLIDGNKITNAARLLFAKKPGSETEIQIGLLETETVIKKSVVINNGLINDVEQVMDFIKAYIIKEYIFTESRPAREERWQYPIKALREFVVNAIIHRDYVGGTHSQFKIFRDKIELWNHGRLLEGLTIQDIYAGTEKSYARNPKIMEIFKDLGLVERYGSGVKRAVAEITAYGLPKPIIKIMAGGFNVEILSAPSGVKNENEGINEGINEGVNEGINLVFDLINKRPGIKANFIASGLNKPLKSVERWLKVLKEKKQIEYRGSRKIGGYFIKK
ncbi:MAG: ATP-binding protein [Patescibacteria group bacterium]|jgi:ATP-dependent DNA helicase RecG